MKCYVSLVNKCICGRRKNGEGEGEEEKTRDDYIVLTNTTRRRRYYGLINELLIVIS